MNDAENMSASCYYGDHDWEAVEQGQTCRRCGRFVPDGSGFHTIHDREKEEATP